VRALCLAIAILAGGCIIPFATPPMRAEVGAASRTGATASPSMVHVAVGAHLASGTQSRKQKFDVGAGWVFQHDVGTDEPSTGNGVYLDGAAFLDPGGSGRTSVGGRTEVMWLPGGPAFALKLRIDSEVFKPTNSPFKSNDRCGSAAGQHIGTVAVGFFTEAGVVRLPEGDTAWTATAGVTFRLPSAVGVYIGIPWCK
jgi:hypothetical protein